MDETKKKIIDAAMGLIMERGYASTTTKDIAKYAQINECTIFRKFKGKKEIVLSAMEDPDWNPNLKEEDLLHYTCELEKDLLFFSELYMRKVTPKMVKLSIGLRAPELCGAATLGILKIPQAFRRVLVQYFQEMHGKGLVKRTDFESMAMLFLSLNFGFVFLSASFGNKLTHLTGGEYRRNSIQIFAKGIV